MRTGGEIKAVRESLGESQWTFAERFGVDQATISRWEADGLPDRGTAAVAIELFLASLKLPAEQSEPNSQPTQAD